MELFALGFSLTALVVVLHRRWSSSRLGVPKWQTWRTMERSNQERAEAGLPPIDYSFWRLEMSSLDKLMEKLHGTDSGR